MWKKPEGKASGFGEVIYFLPWAVIRADSGFWLKACNMGLLHGLKDLFRRQEDLLCIADRRLTVPFLRAIHTEVSMATALKNHLSKITGQI